MSKLVSMKLDARDREQSYPTAAAQDGPIYPWGLSINLGNEELDKLGIGTPVVGKSMMLTARVNVVSVSVNEDSRNGKTHAHRNAGLQITDLCLEADAGEGGSAADKLYNGDKA